MAKHQTTAQLALKVLEFMPKRVDDMTTEWLRNAVATAEKIEAMPGSVPVEVRAVCEMLRFELASR